MSFLCKEENATKDRLALKSKIRSFAFGNNFTLPIVKIARSGGHVKLWSSSYSAFLQDYLFLEKTTTAEGQDVDMLQGPTLSIRSNNGPMLNRNVGLSPENKSSDVNHTQKYEIVTFKMGISIHIKIQLILDVTLAMISLLSLIVAVILLFVLDIPATTKLFIHKNLLFATIISLLVYVFGTWMERDLARHRAICTTFLILSYYSFLAILSWMLVEGVNLVMVLVIVFQAKSKKHHLYAAMGWGIPLITFVVTIAIRPDAFLKSLGCLSLGKDIWLFKGPVAVILGTNFILFIVILYVVIKSISSSPRANTPVQRWRSSLRAFITLVPVLGVSQLTGFALEKYPAIFGYIHIIINGFMGLLFATFHCFMDSQVKEALKKFKDRKLQSTKWSSFSLAQLVPKSHAESCSNVSNGTEKVVYDTKL